MSKAIIPEILNRSLEKKKNIDYNVKLNLEQNYNYSKNYNTQNTTNNYNSKDKGFFGFILMVVLFPFKIILKFSLWILSLLNINVNKKYIKSEYRKYKVFKKIKSRYDSDNEIW